MIRTMYCMPKPLAPMLSSWTPKLAPRQLRYSSTLMKEKAFINGKWCPSKSGATFQVINPANGEVICNVSDCNEVDAEEAIQGAVEAFHGFKKSTPKERSALLQKFFQLQAEHTGELASLLTAENGKPIVESKAEITYGASFLEWFAGEARRMYGDHIPSSMKGKEMLLIRQPIGVAAIITPWNFPNAMITRKIGAALAAGCPCVIKPSPDTPLSALALAQLAHEAGFPAGLISVLPSSETTTPTIGKHLCEHPDVAALSFTGSSAVGKHLLRLCASTIKKVSLELGGNAPFIVFNSANVDKAVVGALACKFRNTGQTCVSANRFLVQEGIYDQFVATFVKSIQQHLKVGDNPQATVGPLINHKAVEKVERHIADAVKKGGKVHLGGKRHSLGGNFFEPTVLTHVQTDMLVCQEETFGPVVSIVKFGTEDEAMHIANSTRAGLAGYFYSEDVSQVWRVAKALEVGMVGVNEGILSCAEAAFGGVKESGLGREGSRYGLDEYTQLKYICFGGLE